MVIYFTSYAGLEGLVFKKVQNFGNKSVNTECLKQTARWEINPLFSKIAL